MRTASSDFLTALSKARTKGIMPRKLLWCVVKDRETGDPQGFGFWTGDDDVTIAVQDGQTGDTVSRLYYGQGTKLKVPNIPRASDLNIPVLSVVLSQTSPIVQAMVREYEPRFGKIEIHEALLSDVSRLLIPNPVTAFLGEIDGDPIETPSVGGEGNITLEVVSDAIRGLTRTNPAKRSYQQQFRRASDKFSNYSNVVANWDISWGEK